ncbi:VCBS domain-containing protein, partial [Pseudodesulfovibrio pelocollis]|uniref:VCBS domain-containing protein n=1 Tax=Pseudodesulfovibrio pelocollis TaxID=3051432 RepID=UPI00255AC571
AGQFGTLTLGANGRYTYTLDNSLDAVQGLGVGESETETFTYTISDGQGGFDSTTLTITINGTNDRPVAVADTAQAFEDGPAVSGNVLDNDYDIDVNDTLTVAAVGGDPDKVGTEVAGRFGTLVINENGTYTYTVDNDNPAVQKLGVGQSATDRFTYTVTDQHGATRSTTLTVTVNGVNDAPVAVA